MELPTNWIVEFTVDKVRDKIIVVVTNEITDERHCWFYGGNLSVDNVSDEII